MIVNDLEAMGFEVEAAHHEVAPGQHEIDFKYAEAVATADDLIDLPLHRPQRGDGARTPRHVHAQAHLRSERLGDAHTPVAVQGGDNASTTPTGEFKLSEEMRWYIGGLKKHARAIAAITNPLVNSYKRLVPGTRRRSTSPGRTATGPR